MSLCLETRKEVGGAKGSNFGGVEIPKGGMNSVTSLASVPESPVTGRSLPSRVALLDVNTSYHKHSFSLFLAVSVISEVTQTSFIFISLTTFQIYESNDIHFKPESSDIERQFIGRKKKHCV